MIKFIEDYTKDDKYTQIYWYILKVLDEDIFVKKEYFYKSNFKENWIYLDNDLIYYIFDIKSNYEIIKFFKDLIENDFLFQAEIYWYSWEEDENLKIPLKEKLIINSKNKKKTEENLEKFYNDYSSSDIFCFDLQVDKVKIKNFLEKYLEDWKEWKLFEEWKNFYNFKKQVEVLTNHIYEKIKKYSDKSLLINLDEISALYNNYIDLFWTLLYLEEIKTIKINVFEKKYQEDFRIEVLENFYEYFQDLEDKKQEKAEEKIIIKYFEENKYFLLNGIKIDLSNNQDEYFKMILDLDILSLKVNFEDLALEFDRNFLDLDGDGEIRTHNLPLSEGLLFLWVTSLPYV